MRVLVAATLQYTPATTARAPVGPNVADLSHIVAWSARVATTVPRVLFFWIRISLAWLAALP